MNERTKLAEARYFYDRMLAEFDNRENFTYNLSAFLAAARSVLLYAREEAQNKSGGQQWYDGWISGSRILSFFRDKRNVNIHFGPVKPVQHIEVTVTDGVCLSDSVQVDHRDKDGKVLYESPLEASQPKPSKPEPPTSVKTEYRFADWSGKEDLMTLSNMYLEELRQLIEDGIHRSFISG